MIGTNYSRATIDSVSGSVSSRLRDVIRDADEFKEWLDGIDPTDLLALGYTQPEVDAMKSSWSDIDGLGLFLQVYRGAASLPNPIDFSIAARRMSGPGR